jgi:hypothetical protein
MTLPLYQVIQISDSSKNNVGPRKINILTSQHIQKQGSGR